MRDLMEATGETANLGIGLIDGMVCFWVRSGNQPTIHAHFSAGTASAMHASAGIGRLLCRMDDKRRQRRVLAKVN
jgi:DNA-binding IclR family transcriptional regulator